jgi:hypothetical protein
VLHRSQRPDAVDPETGERLDDVLMFRVPDLDVKELMLAEGPPSLLHDTARQRLPGRARAHPGPGDSIAKTGRPRHGSVVDQSQEAWAHFV